MSDPRPPEISDDPETAFFWEGTRAGELRIQRCNACRCYIHQPRPVCRRCLSFDLAGERVSGRGLLYSYSVTHRPFHPYYADRVPYAIATVELAEQSGLHLLSRIVDVPLEAIEIGMKLEVRFEPLTDEVVLPVFTRATEGR